LKPNNILVNRDCDLAISDFGLARMATEREEKKLLCACRVRQLGTKLSYSACA
jgi:serine/threonine protein kinase